MLYSFKRKADLTAWGNEVGGLQAGLGFRPGERRPYHHGETVKLVVRVRNVGKEAVKFEYLRQFFIENPPAAIDGEGKPVHRDGITAFGIHIPVEVNLAPGKEIELYELKLELKPASENGNEITFQALCGTGIFRIKYERVFGNSSSGTIALDPTLSKLATGMVALEVKTAEKLPEKEERVAFTAWGKEVGGLQAGLGFRPGEQRPYIHGEEAWIVLRLRNNGKTPVEFSHIGAFFVENPPTITDADGKILQLPKLAAEGLQAPHDTPIAPGKEVVLYEWNCALLPIGGTSKNLFTIHGTGKFTFQCTRIVGPTLGNPNHPNPTLDKLATGKLELEVKAAEKLPEKKEEKKALTAWGKEIRGLQGGVSLERIEVFNAAANRWEATQTPVGKIHQGSDIIFKVFVRNMGKQEVKLKYIEPSCWLYSEDGRNLKFDPFFSGSRNRFWTEKTLQPGEKWEVGQLNVTTREPKPTESFRGLRLFELGKYRVSCPSVLMQEKGNNLATGEVEIEIVSPKRE